MATFPERVLAAVNAALTWTFDLAFGVLAPLPALASLAVVSLASGAAMLWVVARTSDQPRMAASRRAMHAGLFEIRLFNDDPVAILRALFDLLRQNERYLRLSLVPLLWMAAPLLLVVAQLQAFYGYAGLEPGRPALVKATIGAGDAGMALPILDAPDSIRLETAAVRLANSDEVVWRIVPTAAGQYTLRLRSSGGEAAKTVVVSAGVARRSPRRAAPGLVDQLLFPSERPLDRASGIAVIEVSYPEPGIEVLGLRVHWLIVYMVASMACALVLARRFGVTI